MPLSGNGNVKPYAIWFYTTFDGAFLDLPCPAIRKGDDVYLLLLASQIDEARARIRLQSGLKAFPVVVEDAAGYVRPKGRWVRLTPSAIDVMEGEFRQSGLPVRMGDLHECLEAMRRLSHHKQEI